MVVNRFNANPTKKPDIFYYIKINDFHPVSIIKTADNRPVNFTALCKKRRNFDLDIR